MDSSNVAYRSHLVNHLPALARDSDVSERLRFLMSPLLALVLLDLESARSLLTAGYAASKSGRPARDPVLLLRSLVLMLLCGVTSINQWCRSLKGAPELRVLSGMRPQDKPPGVGTFYDFLWRLVDGPYQRRCAHHAPPSERLRGRRFLRQLEQERAQQKEQTQAELARGSQGRVENQVNQRLAARGRGLPEDMEQRLNELLVRLIGLRKLLNCQRARFFLTAGKRGDLKAVVDDRLAVRSPTPDRVAARRGASHALYQPQLSLSPADSLAAPAARARRR